MDIEELVGKLNEVSDQIAASANEQEADRLADEAEALAEAEGLISQGGLIAARGMALCDIGLHPDIAADAIDAMERAWREALEEEVQSLD